MMQTESPGCTRATSCTAPNAVTTPQPTRAAFHSGMPAGSGTADPTGTTHDSAKHDTKLKWRSRSPSTVRSRVVPSDIVPFHAAAPAGSHRFRLPARHWRHAPHAGTMQNTTRSPGA